MMFNKLDKTKEHVFYHPETDRICLWFWENGSNNLLYNMNNDDAILDVWNLVYIGVLG